MFNPNQGPGNAEEEGWKDPKSWMMMKNAVKCCLLDMLRSWHSTTHSSCGYLHTSHTKKIWKQEEHQERDGDEVKGVRMGTIHFRHAGIAKCFEIPMNMPHEESLNCINGEITLCDRFINNNFKLNN